MNKHSALRRMRIAAILAAGAMALPMAHAQQEPIRQLEPVVVSASRSEQRRFDAPAAIDAVRVNAFRAASPLVNLSELLSAVPGLQIRERQNYAQDLQISIRGFGTRSTFGVRGVRILIDGIPATMPDGQGQASTASLAPAHTANGRSARRPAAQDPLGLTHADFNRNPRQAIAATALFDTRKNRAEFRIAAIEKRAGRSRHQSAVRAPDARLRVVRCAQQ